ncbi:gasdermin Eb isoform X3 [Centroberyx gerrardi]
MFATATKNFVEEVDHDGFLVPVSSLNDNIALLSLVVKRKRFWFWQKPKYLSTDFNFNDILTGDTPIQPVVVETDFIKYNGTFGDNIQGNIDANLVHSSVTLEGKDTSKLQSSFGSLKKEEVDVQKLLRDSRDRVLDMSHCLIQQTKEKHRQVFGVVKERIVTTQPCSVIEEVQQAGQCGGLLSLCGPKSSKVTLKENGSLSKDSNVTMEIPSHTTIAYALIELEVKLNGHYELCLMSDTHGGFEVDGLGMKGLPGLSGAPLHASENSGLKPELDRLNGHFHLLSTLAASTRRPLLQHLTAAMEDRETVGVLQNGASSSLSLSWTRCASVLAPTWRTLRRRLRDRTSRLCWTFWSRVVEKSRLLQTSPRPFLEPFTSLSALWTKCQMTVLPSWECAAVPQPCRPWSYWCSVWREAESCL